MAKKDKVEEVAAPKSLDERQAERFLTERNGVHVAEADVAILQRPIDERLAALEADHKRMGVR